VRSRTVLALFASLVTLGFVAASFAPPQGFASAAIAEDDGSRVLATGSQGFTAADGFDNAVGRDAFTVVKPPPPPPRRAAPAAGTPDPGTAKAIAFDMVAERGWGQDQYDCLVALWNRESHWNVYAGNPSSGAYGIPQALPGSKMASVGADWQSNPRTQIVWGLGYISGRYGTPCGAWASSQARGWY